MAFRVDTIMLWVTEIDEAVGWYRQFGIEPGPRFGSWQTMIVDGDTHFALHEGPVREGPSKSAVAFGVENLDHEIQRLEGMALRPIDEVTDTGTARFITYRDLDGNEVQLLERS